MGDRWPPFGSRIDDDAWEEGADLWPDDVAREVLQAAEVTPALLAKMIASVSEEEWCATWMMGVERIALNGWPGVRAVHDHPDVVAAFDRLQREVPGWVGWRGGSGPESGVCYIERAEVSDDRA